MDIRKLTVGLAALLAAGAVVVCAATGSSPVGAKKPDDSGGKQSESGKPPAPAKTMKNKIGMELVLIPAGKFTMGSPPGEEGRLDNEKAHEVEITRPFYLGKYEVTKGEFARFVQDREYHGGKEYQTEAERDGKGGWGLDAGGAWRQKPEYTWRNTGWTQTDRHPVVNVSRNDAVAFCKWLSAKEGKKYRLPTEAEWEYSCRAGTTTAFHSGSNDPETLATVANVADVSFKRKFPKSTTIKADDGYVFTAPVGKFKPNAFGLYDMLGNAWEWCQDWYDSKYYENSPKQDPVCESAGACRVVRGGSFNTLARSCRAASRPFYEPAARFDNIGFRVVCVP
jgi:formylglycine-generating enzyme required for sulfatase activity